MQYNIDWNFIARLEGGRRIHGYVPDAARSKSGITIATGFDLGQRSLSDLENLKLSQALIEKLRPYLGLKKQVAEAYLKNHPLTITPEQAKSIDIAVKSQSVNKLVRTYNGHSSVSFASLPGAAQTVIASVSFQYGHLPSETPKFFKLVTNRDWTGTVQELRNFGDQYSTRRKQEADRLQTILSGTGARSQATTASTRTLRRGDRGDLVRDLQERLNNSNLAPLARLLVDGHFGAATERQVREFQKRRGLTVDGVVGRTTWNALRAKR